MNTSVRPTDTVTIHHDPLDFSRGLVHISNIQPALRTGTFTNCRAKTPTTSSPKSVTSATSALWSS
ncbi:MAG: hypothetical protein H6678_11205 [Candidatus Delongbacteria bacterium]|nr:hypothetical protein [Anaerolineae bacterium]MCB9474368.1 hypothetical protein [Candidatus Delongbacteria bacterium]